ncbi:ABC transporter ATP-binding protein [Dictyobacter sp. S3.2.2.5]|uniref:ABC transporter ATP-binding protein n=1 Tax=Dictyobacter halimunensis TaxID=3026934 RepID=A0ABQ6FIX7_9CHLR|nr:ABC transporter ATP-binding protein [Dictyobacter sp. S3.2.2.5]
MIRLNNVVATYTTRRGSINAVDGINLEIPDGITLGIAGESGCGKSTLMKVIYGDLGFPLTLSSGNIEYGLNDERGKAITSKTIRRQWFRHISYIPQSSMSSLNPVTRIRDQFVDFQGPGRNKAKILTQVRAYIQQLGLPEESIDSYPHQLSGGMRQRIMVAMATFFQPEIILADEPTTALDVVVQKSILQLLMNLQEQMGNTIIFVSHDMGVHYQITHRMLVMYAAKAVEYGSSETVFSQPLHPYTRMLIESLPMVGDDQMRQGVPGSPPSLWSVPQGCRFAARCSLATDLCREKEPAFIEHRPGHFAACHYAGNEQKVSEKTA